MPLHAPPGYRCPFCLVVTGVENEHTLSSQAVIVLRAWLAENPMRENQAEHERVL